MERETFTIRTGTTSAMKLSNSQSKGMAVPLRGMSFAEQTIPHTFDRSGVKTRMVRSSAKALQRWALDRGPPNVRLEERDMGQGQTLLSLVNGELQPVFVAGWISVRKNGQEVRKCGLGILFPEVGRERACVVFSGEQYLYNLDAEKDPD
jgi:hypothetical protein